MRTYNKKIDRQHPHKEKGKNYFLEPLYTQHEVDQVMKHFVCYDYDRRFRIFDDVLLTFTNSGHMLGSAILGTQDPKAEDVEIIFDPSAKFYLDEKPFHRSMKVEELKNGQLRVTMKVEANELLYRWVLSYADSAEVLKPISLRNRLNEFSYFLHSTYYHR